MIKNIDGIMKDFLKKFENIINYNNWKNSIRYIEPNVSLIENEGVQYNPYRAKYDYSKEYLTFEAIEDTTFTFTRSNLQYSIDNGISWITLSANTATPTISAGNKILWKQTLLTPISKVGIGTFSATGKFNAHGNIMTLYYGDNFERQTDLTGKNWAFYKLFDNNTKLVDASNLILPATTLARNCYCSMFYGCTSLTQAPALPATTLANSCYEFMFYGCTSLTQAPALPATTLAICCYQSMFKGCTSLTTAPELPATTLAYGCYEFMFYGCKSLVTVPELPATTLVPYCYASMFMGCRSLTTAPELPSTILAVSCYNSMFYGCKSLVTVPELPATTLAERCYEFMFYGCTSLTQAPALPATTLANCCYQHMFEGCTHLSYIECIATTNLSDITNNTLYWTTAVASSGTFVKDVNTSWNMGENGIPNGWTIRFYGYGENNYVHNYKLYLESGFPYMLDNNFLNQFIGYDFYVDNIYVGKVEQNSNGNHYTYL